MDRQYLYISFTDFVYVRLQALVWSYNGLSVPRCVDKNAADALVKIYSNVDTQKSLIVDCRNITSFTDRAMDGLFKQCQKSNREISFINYMGVEERIGSLAKEYLPSVQIVRDDKRLTVYYSSVQCEISKETINQIKSKIIDTIKSDVKKSFFKFPNGEQRLKSTPILAAGVYDASPLISNPASFILISLQLADRVEEIIEQHQIGKPSQPGKLLSVSLRSAPFAGAVSLLLGMQLETADHFGPVNKPIEIDESNYSKTEFIYIGDFIVGGTEIKISKNFAAFKNAKLEHAIVIGSLFEPDIFENEFTLHPLISIRNLHPEAKFNLH